jgi:hypothetical protein
VVRVDREQFAEGMRRHREWLDDNPEVREEIAAWRAFAARNRPSRPELAVKYEPWPDDEPPDAPPGVAAPS